MRYSKAPMDNHDPNVRWDFSNDVLKKLAERGYFLRESVKVTDPTDQVSILTAYLLEHGVDPWIGFEWDVIELAEEGDGSRGCPGGQE